MVAPGGHVWFFRGGAWFFMGVCMVSWGACMVFSGGVCIGYDEIWSMSRRYASYWNAFLFARRFTRRIRRICGLSDTMS